MKWGLYVWERIGETWQRQVESEQKRIIRNGSTALHFDSRFRLPSVETMDGKESPPESPDELHPAHRDYWYYPRLPEGYHIHIAEGAALPDTERLIFVWLSARGREWLAVAGLGVNEYAGDNRPTEADCLDTAIKVMEYHLESMSEP